MRLISICFASTFVLAGAAQADPTPLLGVEVVQNGAPVPVQVQDGVTVATLSAAPFGLSFPGGAPDVVGVTFGQPGLFDLLDIPPETGLFGSGTSYARNTGLTAGFFMTDPLCASAYYGPGFNLLDADRRSGDTYPVHAIEVDSRSNTCDADNILPVDVNLIGRLNPIHMVIRTDDGIEALILSFVGS